MRVYVLIGIGGWVLCGVLSVVWTLAVLRKAFPRIYPALRREFLGGAVRDALTGPLALAACVYHFWLKACLAKLLAESPEG